MGEAASLPNHTEAVHMKAAHLRLQEAVFSAQLIGIVGIATIQFVTLTVLQHDGAYRCPLKIGRYSQIFFPMCIGAARTFLTSALKVEIAKPGLIQRSNDGSILLFCHALVWPARTPADIAIGIGTTMKVQIASIKFIERT